MLNPAIQVHGDVLRRSRLWSLKKKIWILINIFRYLEKAQCRQTSQPTFRVNLKFKLHQVCSEEWGETFASSFFSSFLSSWHRPLLQLLLPSLDKIYYLLPVLLQMLPDHAAIKNNKARRQTSMLLWKKSKLLSYLPHLPHSCLSKNFKMGAPQCNYPLSPKNVTLGHGIPRSALNSSLFQSQALF